MKFQPAEERDINEIILAMERFCVYQDRCTQEIKQKMYKMGVAPDWQETVLSHLIEENFLNEARFAGSFCGGKLRVKHWGRNKIRLHLKQKQIPTHLIEQAIAQIEEEQYLSILLKVLKKKASLLHISNPFEAKQKIARHAIQKGFETDLVWEHLKDLPLHDE